MQPNEFRSLLDIASRAAIDFANQHVTQSLNYCCVYDVFLNQSHDAHATAEMTLYPEDDNVVRKRLSAAEVVELLCRNSKCPQWIDISATGVNPQFTVMTLLCCGRYVDDRSKLYYEARQGTGPFGIKSPNLPRDYQVGIRFSLPEILS